jgi:hypothetical protein
LGCSGARRGSCSQAGRCHLQIDLQGHDQLCLGIRRFSAVTRTRRQLKLITPTFPITQPVIEVHAAVRILRRSPTDDATAPPVFCSIVST